MFVILEGARFDLINRVRCCDEMCLIGNLTMKTLKLLIIYFWRQNKIEIRNILSSSSWKMECCAKDCFEYIRDMVNYYETNYSGIL